MKRYTESHEWFDPTEESQSGLFKIGISSHAAEQLGDVVFVELPEIGKEVEAGNSMAVIESVKAVGDLYAPFTGIVKAVNEDLNDQPGNVTADPEGDGWILVLEASDAEGAGKQGMTQEEYQAKLASEE